MWSEECGMWNEECGLRNGECRMRLLTPLESMIAREIIMFSCFKYNIADISNGVEKRCLTIYREGSIITKMQKSKSKYQNDGAKLKVLDFMLRLFVFSSTLYALIGCATGSGEITNQNTNPKPQSGRW